MARGGAYENPDVNVGIDRQSGQMIGQAIAGIGQQIGAAAANASNKMLKAQQDLAERKRKEAEKERIRAEENWRITKAVESEKTQAVLDWQNTLAEQSIETGTLNSSFDEIINKLYDARKRYDSSRSDYEGREEDEALIRNSKEFLNNVGDRFATVNSMTSTYKEKARLMGQPGGIDPEATDNRFTAMMLIGDGNGTGINEGSVGWETATGPGGKIQMFQVAESDQIKRANYINGLPPDTKAYNDDGTPTDPSAFNSASREYRLSYEDVTAFLNDDDNNPNTFGPFSLIQDDRQAIKDIAKTNGIFDDQGQLNPGDPTQPGSGFIIEGDIEKKSDDIGVWNEQKTWPNTAKIVGKMNTDAAANASTELQWSASQPSANSNIRANAENRKIKVDGKETNEYFVPQYGEIRNGVRIYREQDGTLIKDKMPDIILGNDIDGLMSQGNEKDTNETFGYSKEEYDNYVKFNEYKYSKNVGGFNQPSELPTEGRKYERKFTAAELIAKQQSSNTSNENNFNKNEKTVYDRLNKGPKGFADFYKEITLKEGELSKDGSTFTIVDGNGTTEKIDMNDEQKVIGLLKQLLADEKMGFGKGKEQSSAIFKIVEQYRKDKFGNRNYNSSGGQGSSSTKPIADSFTQGELN